MDRDTCARVLAHGMGLHDKLAGITAGRSLSCCTCRRVENPSREDMADYFRNGWPKCCGYTMTLDKLPSKESSNG